MNIALVIAFVGMVVFLAHLLAEIFSRTKVPDVLSLFLLGFLIGPVFKLVSPEHFGNVGPVFTTITLVIILFEGGMGLHLDELRSTMRPALTLTVASFFATMLIVGAVTWTILGPTQAFMLGAIVGGTSSAVVIPLVAQLKMEKGSRAVLIVESAVS
ncbi:MAG: cation:proton antiporter, partial [Bacteroidetes bacterium]|nr:cation:proton antiporter [Bacteroidota bacterium]